MKIACLCWGSLFWLPKSLLVLKPWYINGPVLPVEFARESTDKRITLVITKDDKPVQTLWGLMDTSNVQTAIESLAEREKISHENIRRSIGCVDADKKEPDNPIEKLIFVWAKDLSLDFVIWTNLKPKFNGVSRKPKFQEIEVFINSLPETERKCAEEYVRRAPKQIQTEYRKEFEDCFGWRYSEEN